MKKSITVLFILSAFCILNFAFTGCGIYSFNQKGTLPDSLKTVRVQLFENRAPYVNPQLTPNLTDRLRQKITRQTKLTQTNNDNANLDISGTITDYSVTTTGVTSVNGQKQTSVNRLTITVHVIFNNQLGNDVKEADVSHSFDFSANQSLQQAEAALLDEMVRNLSDEIFNRIFSDW
jgi:outer membrane lipopolysaccharide assembly protein LptE/RlpB